MRKPIFDFDDGDFIFPISDKNGIDSNGNFIHRFSKNMAMDMESGDLHITSNWDDEDEE